MPLPPSRRDTIGPPGSGVSDLAALVRHHDSALRQLDSGLLGGRWRSLTPVPKGPPPQLVGGDAAGDDTDYAWEWDDRHTVTVLGTQTVRLSHVPIDETLHVRWHAGGLGGEPLTNELFTVDEQLVTIPSTGVLALGDEFSFQYEYEVSDDVLDFEFIAGVTGVFHFPENTITFTPPPEMQPGDFLVVAVRGSVAPGGGDITLGVTSGDSRITLHYTATPPVIQAVLTGFATGSTADVVANVIPNPSYSPGARGVMMIFRGVSAATSHLANEVGGGATPQVAGTAAIAVTWNGNSSFAIVHSEPPDGYTDGGSTGFDYFSTDVSYWFDPSDDISPAGTFPGEGVLVIGLT